MSPFGCRPAKWWVFLVPMEQEKRPAFMQWWVWCDPMAGASPWAQKTSRGTRCTPVPKRALATCHKNQVCSESSPWRTTSLPSWSGEGCRPRTLHVSWKSCWMNSTSKRCGTTWAMCSQEGSGAELKSHEPLRRDLPLCCSMSPLPGSTPLRWKTFKRLWTNFAKKASAC